MIDDTFEMNLSGLKVDDDEYRPEIEAIAVKRDRWKRDVERERGEGERES